MAKNPGKAMAKNAMKQVKKPKYTFTANADWMKNTPIDWSAYTSSSTESTTITFKDFEDCVEMLEDAELNLTKQMSWNISSNYDTIFMGSSKKSKKKPSDLDKLDYLLEPKK